MKLSERVCIFDAWMNEHQALIFKVIRAYAFSPQDREDLFQEVTVQIWNSIPNFQGNSAATTWIYRVALFSAISWSRTEKKYRSGRESMDGIEPLLMITETKDDRLDWLYEQIAKLDEIDRSITLLLLDGFRYKEIAATLGISESHVGVKINRIKKILSQQALENKNHGF